LLCAWLLFILVNVLICFVNVRKTSHSVQQLCIQQIKGVSKLFVVYLLFGLFMIFLAYHTTPYNSDSMAYHLPRIARWAQNKSVAHYSAHHLHEVSAPVFAEYIQLHNYILSGYSDSFICLTQCLSYVIDGVLVYNLAKEIGCSNKWSYVSSLIFISLPVSFGEALNTQVDLITPLFVLSVAIMIVYLCMFKDTIQITVHFIVIALCIGVCSGLAYMSKNTAAFAMLPLFAWLFIACVKKMNIRTIILYAGLVAVIAFLVYLPEAHRLRQTFGSIFPSDTGSHHLIETIDPRLILLCFVKTLGFNLSGHLFYNSREWLLEGVEKIAGLLNVDLEDPRISYSYAAYDINTPFTYHHDLANGNLITLLFLFSIAVVTIKIIYNAVINKRIKHMESQGYVISCFIAFMMFSSVCKFTTHRSRYLIVFFALLCPAVCYVFQNSMETSRQRILITVIVFVSVCEIISLSLYHCHVSSYLGERPKGYFGGHPAYEGHYKSIEFLKEKNYNTLGLINGYAFEYPLYAMTRDFIGRIEDVNVENASSIHEDTNYHPDAVLIISLEPILENSINVHGLEYGIINKFNDDVGYYAVAESPYWSLD